MATGDFELGAQLSHSDGDHFFFFDAVFVCCGAGPSPSDSGNEWLLAGDEAKLIFLWAASLAYHGTRWYTKGPSLAHRGV